jgi:hypothetical protein
MSIAKDRNTNAGEPAAKLATEWPLTEKDVQGDATERQRQSATQALEKWRRLQEKTARPHNNKDPIKH